MNWTMLIALSQLIILTIPTALARSQSFRSYLRSSEFFVRLLAFCFRLPTIVLPTEPRDLVTRPTAVCWLATLDRSCVPRSSLASLFRVCQQKWSVPGYIKLTSVWQTTYDFETSFTGLSLGTSQSASDSPSYIYCDTEAHTKALVDHLTAFLASERSNHTIFLDCEGRDLGRVGGKLGLVQLGIENEVYLVDIITYPEALDSLKPILENSRLKKVVWDGRNDYCELWHGHGIELRSPLDLQLVRVYEACNGRSGSQGFIMLQGMGKVFQSKGTVVRESGINQSRLEEGTLSFSKS